MAGATFEVSYTNDMHEQCQISLAQLLTEALQTRRLSRERPLLQNRSQAVAHDSIFKVLFRIRKNRQNHLKMVWTTIPFRTSCNFPHQNTICLFHRLVKCAVWTASKRPSEHAGIYDNLYEWRTETRTETTGYFSFRPGFSGMILTIRDYSELFARNARKSNEQLSG